MFSGFRLYTLVNCLEIADSKDEILHQIQRKIEVINGGKIEAEGTHDELLQKSKTYSAMWDAYTLSSDWQISKKKEVAQA